ncbi:MAG: ribosome maturation factor RimM [Myxococcota bacterium]
MPESSGDPLVAVGVISRPHGVRGALRIHPYNDESELWSRKLAAVWLRAPDAEDERRMAVTSCRRAAKYAIVELEGVAGREGADALRGHEVSVPRSALPDIDEDEFYFADIAGLPVLRAGEAVGEVVRVLQYPSIDCLEVRSPDGVREVPVLEPWLEGIDEAGVHVGPWDDLPVRT